MTNFNDKQNSLYRFNQIFDVDYDLQESPSTQAYHRVAAQDNPDYAQAIGDMYRWGDVNRAKFKTDLDMLSGLNKREYLQQVQQEQRDYAKQLRDEQRAYNEKQQAKAWARADAKAKELRDQQLRDMQFKIALEHADRETPDLRDLSKYTGYRDVGGVDRQKLTDDRNNLINAWNNVYNPENLVGSSPYEILYNALQNERQIANDIDEYNNQRMFDIINRDVENTYRDRSNSAYLTSTKSILENETNAPELWENDTRGYAAKTISENPFRRLTHGTKGNKAEFLDTFMKEHNAVDPNGWDTDTDTKLFQMRLNSAGYDTTNLAPLFGEINGEVIPYVFDSSTGTIYELGKDEQNNDVLVPVDQMETNLLGRLFNRFK